jgi:hypothetical protein
MAPPCPDGGVLQYLSFLLLISHRMHSNKAKNMNPNHSADVEEEDAELKAQLHILLDRFLLWLAAIRRTVK